MDYMGLSVLFLGASISTVWEGEPIIGSVVMFLVPVVALLLRIYIMHPLEDTLTQFNRLLISAWGGFLIGIILTVTFVYFFRPGNNGAGRTAYENKAAYDKFNKFTAGEITSDDPQDALIWPILYIMFLAICGISMFFVWQRVHPKIDTYVKYEDEDSNSEDELS